MSFDFIFHCSASSHCPGRKHISQRTLLSHLLSLQWVLYTLGIQITLSEIKLGLTEVVPPAVATVPVLLQSLECFFTTHCCSFQNHLGFGHVPCKKLSVSYLVTTSSNIISAVCKSMHLYIYLHVSSCMQDLAFWRIVRHPNFLPTGIMRSSLVDWTSVPDSHWEAHQVSSSFRHFGKSYYVPVCTLGCLNYLEKLALHSLYFQSCGLWSLVATTALETWYCTCRAWCLLLLVLPLWVGFLFLSCRVPRSASIWKLHCLGYKPCSW